MLKSIMIVASATLVISVLAYAETVTSVDCTNAWSGATNYRPEWYEDPRDLADEGHLLSWTERGYLTEWDEAIYYWEEPDPPTDYTYLLFTFPDFGEEMTDAYVDWSFWVDVEYPDFGGGTDRDPNSLCYWDGSEQRFVHIDGCDPDNIYEHSVNAYVAWENNGDAENVTFLLYGYTPYSNETWAKCNEAKARVYFADGE